ncbi:hypothetical protein M378DRAFT_19493 [Amanita muscaria Koide BX008]|uniref:Uncharacterized protein n=1 Tax=Amanita muscaria (strain Koide BX008) TaxID=946122 RepID=A0A0C2RUC5_AMAMK|nr:hypothetical protein M378DRAFT_19493 [Amanita muscaria Koide BX008]
MSSQSQFHNDLANIKCSEKLLQYRLGASTCADKSTGLVVSFPELISDKNVR